MTLFRFGKRKTRTVYAVSARGIGIFSNTFATSRREAIMLFQAGCSPGSFALDWSKAKHAGYRTVRACLEITDRDGTRRRAIR
jgi:hypothetical protein